MGSTESRTRTISSRESGDGPIVLARHAASSTGRPASSQRSTWLSSSGRIFGSDAAPIAAISSGSHAADVDEEPRERGQIEHAAGGERTGECGASGRQPVEAGFGACGQPAFGLDIQDADDRAPDEERKGGSETGQSGDVVGVGADVGNVLRSAQPDDAASDAAVHPDAVRYHRIASLGDEPEASVLEHEDRGQQPRRRLVQCGHGGVERLQGLVLRGGPGRGLRGREWRQPEVELDRAVGGARSLHEGGIERAR